jgi:hypothetical protein
MFQLESGDGAIVELPDPSGGTFDAAGDFDDFLLGAALDLLFSQVDPYGDVPFTSDQAQSLVAEVDWLLTRVGDRSPHESQGRPGMSWRGLLRLKTMALYCADHPGSRIVWKGD